MFDWLHADRFDSTTLFHVDCDRGLQSLILPRPDIVSEAILNLPGKLSDVRQVLCWQILEEVVGLRVKSTDFLQAFLMLDLAVLSLRWMLMVR